MTMRLNEYRINATFSVHAETAAEALAIIEKRVQIGVAVDQNSALMLDSEVKIIGPKR